jgi:hypothetical protein
MNVGIGSEAALFPGKEYIMDISFAVWYVKGGRVRWGDVRPQGTQNPYKTS